MNNDLFLRGLFVVEIQVLFFEHVSMFLDLLNKMLIK